MRVAVALARRALSTALLLLLIWLDEGRGCSRSSSGYRRQPRAETALLLHQSVPDVAERDASGPLRYPKLGPIQRNSARFRRLVRVKSRHIVFKNSDAHYMSKRCAQRLKMLSFLVRNTWRGSDTWKVRVVEAWNPASRAYNDDGILHTEGRALVLTTSPRDKSKIGLLGRKAEHAGFDWVKRVSRKKLHVSCKHDSQNSRSWMLRCFPGSSTVALADGTRKALSALTAGDSVLAVDHSGRPIFSPFLTFLDRLPDRTEQFVALRTSDGRQIVLSDSHLIFRAAAAAGWSQGEAVLARQVRLGDRVWTADLASVSLVNVTSVARTSGRGAYAPLTAAGTLVVDGVVASCYAATRSQRLAHAVMAPLRWTAALLGAPAVDSASTGIHWYARLLLSLSNALHRYFDVTFLA